VSCVALNDFTLRSEIYFFSSPHLGVMPTFHRLLETMVTFLGSRQSRGNLAVADSGCRVRRSSRLSAGQKVPFSVQSTGRLEVFVGRPGLGVIPPSDGCVPGIASLVAGPWPVSRLHQSARRRVGANCSSSIRVCMAHTPPSHHLEPDDTTPPSCLQPRPAAPQWLPASQARMAGAQSGRRPEGLHERKVLSWERRRAMSHDGRFVPGGLAQRKLKRR